MSIVEIRWVVVHWLPHSSLPWTAGAVGGATASGTEVAGAVGGIIAAAVMIVGLFVTISWNNATRRREYEQEIREAEKRGEDRYRADMEFYRAFAFTHANTLGQPLPTPPSQLPDPAGGA